MSKSKKHIMSDNSSEVSEDEEYEVEKILKMRINPKTKKKEYLVKWENYPFESSTWEPEVNLKNVRDIVDEFEAQQLLRGGSVPDSNSTTISALQKKLPSLTLTSKKTPAASAPPPLSALPLQTAPATPTSLQNTAKKPHGVSQSASTTSSATKKKHPSTEKEYEKNSLFLADFARLASDKFIQENVNDKKHKQKQKEQESKQNKAQLEKSPSRTASPAGLPFNPNTEDDDFEDGQMEYVFEKIENKRVVKDNAEYLVTFQGMNQSQWVQESDLQDFAVEIELYNANEKQIELAKLAEAEAAELVERQASEQKLLLEQQLQAEEFESSNNSSIETEEIKTKPSIAPSQTHEEVNHKKGGLSNNPKKSKSNKATPIATPTHRQSSEKEKRYLKSGSAHKHDAIKEFNIHDDFVRSPEQQQQQQTSSNLKKKLTHKDHGQLAAVSTSQVKKSKWSYLNNHNSSTKNRGQQAGHSTASSKKGQTAPESTLNSRNMLVADQESQQTEEEEEEEAIPMYKESKDELNSKNKRDKRMSNDYPAKQGKQQLIMGDTNGDFKTDNVDSVEILGEVKSILTCRVEVTWIPRDDCTVPMPTIYSSSYLRKHEPEILIDYLMNALVKSASVQQQQSN